MSQGQGNIIYSTKAGGSGSGAVTPGAPANSVQFNNAGAFGGSAGLLWNNGASTLALAGILAFPNTDLAFTQGIISFNGQPWLHNFDNSGILPGTSFNISMGQLAGNPVPANVGDFNIAIGYQAISSVTTAQNCTGIGVQALERLTTGINNTAYGNYALQNATTGQKNSATGVQALNSLTTGNQNIAIGNGAGESVTSGSDNIFVGYLSGFSIVAGNYNVIIGDQVWGGANPDISNILLIGGNPAFGAASLIYGEFNNHYLQLNCASVQITGSGGGAPPARNGYSLQLNKWLTLGSAAVGALTDGALEYDGVHLYFTIGAVRHTII